MVDFNRHLRQRGRAGIQTYSLVGLDYLDPDDLTVTVSTVGYGDISPTVATFTVDALRQTITILSPTIVGGEYLQILRDTGSLPANRPVDWLAKTTPLTADDLNTSVDHLLFVIQEAMDQAQEIGRFSPYMGIFDGLWEGQGLRIQNLASADSADDAVRLDDMNAAVASANNLPSVTGGDDDSGLAVVAGAWATTPPSALRTAWGLGTAALLDAGTAASELVQLDGLGRLPAVDGRNLDLSQNTDVDVAGKRPAKAVSIFHTDLLWNTNITDTTWWYNSAQRLLMSGGTRTEVNADQSVVKTDQIQTWSAFDLEAGTWLILWSGACTRLAGSPTHYFNFAVVEDDNTASAVQWWEMNQVGTPPPASTDKINFTDEWAPVGGENQAITFGGSMIRVSTGQAQGGDGVTFRGRDSSSSAVTFWPYLRVTAIKIAD